MVFWYSVKYVACGYQRTKLPLSQSAQVRVGAGCKADPPLHVLKFSPAHVTKELCRAGRAQSKQLLGRGPTEPSRNLAGYVQNPVKQLQTRLWNPL